MLSETQTPLGKKWKSLPFSTPQPVVNKPLKLKQLKQNNMSTIVVASPIHNPHQSILRRRHNIIHRPPSSLCKSVPRKRRQSLAAVQSNVRNLPPTPCKTNYKSAYAQKKRIKKYNTFNRVSAIINKSRTPSPNKKKRIKFTKNTQQTKQSKLNNDYHYFENLGLIGVGSFCHVFKVKNLKTNKVFAIKKSFNILNTREAVDEALNEVEIIKLLQKENDTKHIIKFYDFWISHKRILHQVYDYYQHGTLLDVVEYNNRLNYLQILQILQQICQGLKQIHHLNIIHLDLKPGNIFFAKDYLLKIGDFGISVNLNNDSMKSKKYKYSGDPIYIAPELLNFNRNIDDLNTKIDIFSLGIILLELLCDIKAPSQGQIFQNLRSNIVDFNVMEPSPIKASKFRFDSKIISEINQTKGFSFQTTTKTTTIIEHPVDDKDTEVTQDTDDPITIMEEIDDDIKNLCIQMLKKESGQRPNIDEIISKIQEILDNERYLKHFRNCKSMKTLSLPPKDGYLNNWDKSRINQSINQSHNGSINQSICNSICKKPFNDSFDDECNLELSFNENDKNEGNDDNDCNNIISPKWFIKQSPKCYNTLFINHTDKINKIEIGDIMSNDNDLQLNLNSAFDNAQNSPLPIYMVFSSTEKDKNQSIESKQNENQHKNENVDDDDFAPKNLLFSFT